MILPMKKTPSNPVGRPQTGRSIARYWLKNTTIAIIAEQARKAGCKRDADYLEKIHSKP